MKKSIDCTTLQCPGPVLKTKELLEQNALTEIEVIVDNEAAVENISRFLSFSGFEVGVDSNGTVSTVSGSRSEQAAKESVTAPQSQSAEKQNESGQKTLIIVASDRIGRGDDELGGKLMVNFVKTLKEMHPDLWRLVFLNHGVLLCTQESDVLQELKALEESGVSVLACGACMTHLGVLDKKAVGETTNMLDIITSMQLADKVINF